MPCDNGGAGWAPMGQDRRRLREQCQSSIALDILHDEYSGAVHHNRRLTPDNYRHQQDQSGRRTGSVADCVQW